MVFGKKINLIVAIIVLLLVSTMILCSCKKTQIVQGEKGEMGESGKDGEDGKTPHIGENGNWWIGDLDTGVYAAGEKGDKGDQGIQGEKGEDGKTPYIGEDGNWWIDGENTGVDAYEPNIKIAKYCTVPKAKTVNSGDTVIYFLTVENLANKDILVYAEDTVPKNTVYVNGADFINGEKLLWAVSVPKGQTVSVHYTVKVDSSVSMFNGVKIDSTTATVGKKSATTNAFYVGRTLNSLDTELMNIAIDSLYSSTYSDLEFARWAYGVAYSNAAVISTNLGKSSLTVINSLCDGSATNKIKDMVAPTLYGGKNINADIVGVKGSPASSVSRNDLVIGDILITLTDEKSSSYIYSERGLRSLSKERDNVDTDALLSSIAENDAYVILRPSLLLVNFTPADTSVAPDTLTEKQRVIVETAKYYLHRGEWLQYDDTSFAHPTNLGKEYRWECGLNSPEEYTRDNFGYINCAAFTHDVYWTVYGKELPSSMYTTLALTNYSDDNNMKVYSYTRTADQTHTDAQKASIESEFMSKLQPGDIIVIRRGTSSGHALLYIGNGMIIHSTGGNFIYANSEGVGHENAEPTIFFHRVKDYLFNPNITNGYVFGPVTSLCLVRPLNSTTWANYTIPQNSLNRVNNLSGIIAEKLVSVPNAVTVNKGDEIVYTFRINNTNSYDVNLAITDVIGANVEYVSGSATVSGSNLSWNVTVPANETIDVSYTVKVKSTAKSGAAITADKATIGGVLFKTYTTYVGRTLTADEQAKIVQAIKDIRAEGTTLKDLALVNEIYKRALGVDNIFASTNFLTVTEGSEGIFTSSGLDKTSEGAQPYTLSDSGKYRDMLAPSLFGGRLLSTAHQDGRRTRLPIEDNFVIGDVILGRTLSSTVIFMYVGDGQFVIIGNGISYDSLSASDRMERLLGYGYYFAVVRPSFTLDK